MDDKISIDFRKLKKMGLVPIKLNISDDKHPKMSNKWANGKGKYYMLPRNIEKGVYFDTIVMVPNEVNPKTRMAMTTRNTGSPSGSLLGKGRKIDKKIEDLTDKDMKEFRLRNSWPIDAEYSQVSGQNEILVYPCIIQRAKGPYFQQLTRRALLDKTKGFKRIDLQIINAVDTIRDIFKKQGVYIPEKMDLLGQSAAGTFAQRFGGLHYDRTNICATNGAKDAPPLPIAQLEDGTKLPYPYGTADYYDLTGHPFEIEKAREVKLFTSYGMKEDEKPHRAKNGKIFSNYDKSELIGSITSHKESKILKMLGATQAERMLRSYKIFRENGFNLSFLGFMDYGHYQGKGTYEVTGKYVELANREDENVQKEIAETKKKYRTIDLGDIAGNPEREKRFIEASNSEVLEKMWKDYYNDEKFQKMLDSYFKGKNVAEIKNLEGLFLEPFFEYLTEDIARENGERGDIAGKDIARENIEREDIAEKDIARENIEREGKGYQMLASAIKATKKITFGEILRIPREIASIIKRMMERNNHKNEQSR